MRPEHRTLGRWFCPAPMSVSPASPVTFSHHREDSGFCVPPQGSEKHYEESCQRWLDTEKNILWSLSAWCWSSRLRNKPLCTEGFVVSKNQSKGVLWMGETDSGCHCNSSQKLGPLIGIYTTPCCRALSYLDPVAKLIWKVESFS